MITDDDSTSAVPSTSDIKKQTVKCWYRKGKMLQYILYPDKNTSQRL